MIEAHIKPFDEDLRSEAVEQMLRVSGDTSLAWTIQTANTTDEVLTAIGRLLTEVPLTLVAGSPFMALLGYTDLDAEWRRFYPPRSGSLWREMEMFAELDMIDEWTLSDLVQAQETWMLETGAPLRA